MALPAEPRQKMINLMYLVLTAMLALNISAEILNAFKTVNNSIETTNGTINSSTNTLMASLLSETTKAETAEKARIWYAKAKQIQDSTNSLISYISTLKNNVYTGAGRDVKKNGDSTFKEDDQDVATRLLADGKDGADLYARLANYKKNMLAIDPLITREFANSLQIDLNVPITKSHGENLTWQGVYFRMVPTVAAITMLSKFQNDVKTTENKLVAFCHQQVGQVEVIFDKFEPIVGQSSNYLMPGQELTITAGIGAFNSQAQPQVTIGGQAAKVENGIAKYTTSVGGVGTSSIPINIRYINQDGKWVTYPTKVEYTVGQSATAISLTKMNVLYIGVDNPVSIAASGGAEQLNPAISQGSLTKTGPGQYIARVSTQTDNCTIAVNVAGKLAGQQVFRVRNIPDPVGSVGGYASGDNIPANAFKAQGGVAAGIRDFPFDLKYSVTSFTITADTDDGDIVEVPVQGNTWNAQAKTVISRVKPGQLVTIDAIRATGPDGRTRKLPSLVYYIK